MATPRKNIVILGGSYGGISVAHNLLKHAVPKLAATTESEAYQVVLVSSASQTICRPACPRALLSDELFAQDKLFVNIESVFAQYPENTFRFVHGTATQLDHMARKVHVNLASGAKEEEIINFHALVIATGSSTTSPLLGLTTGQDEQFLKQSWKTFRKALPNAKTIVVGGGGPTGVETAGELGQFLNGRAGWFSASLPSPKVQIILITSAPRILPILRPELAEKAERYLAKVGVCVVKNTRIESVVPAGAGGTDMLASSAEIKCQRQGGGETFKADLYMPAMGTTPNTKFIDKSLLTADGRVDTNASTLRADKAGERIYAIGDAASCSRPAIHLLMEAVPVLCANIKKDLLLEAGLVRKDTASGLGEDRTFKEDTRESQLVPIGTSKGVGAMMGYQIPSFFVWLIKGRDYWLWTTGRLWSGRQWASES